MTSAKLPQRATTAETCQWLGEQTGTQWNLARLLEHGLTPYVWVDYSDEYADLFAEGITGYSAPVVYIEDTKRLAAGSDDVLIRFTRDSDRIAIKLKEPGMRMPLDAVRFFQRDIEQLAGALLNPPAPETPPAPKESLKGISKEQVLIVFGGMAKVDLEKALAGGISIFGDDCARVRKNSRGGKNTHLWNPVTLALGLNDVYRVPMRSLKKAFATQPQLIEWRAAWLESLRLLGE
ncbi:hypothetical protein Q4S45_19160 [Massilia sp. R2A-15]|uniref:hypothetical protein n=1 Tax=Massilia sp. R2A-15 TaxID=3064278 RepID=UPI0027328168|nr:hypothetical protein [Massilia sp. R2A-15]WLI88803.1 hypothetical protein Q4S45_19160 [Massilia sp. R2A-15]